DRVQVAQAADHEITVAPVELLPAQLPFERHTADAVLCVDVEVVERRATELGALLRAGVAQRRIGPVAVGDVAPGNVTLLERIVVPGLCAEPRAVVVLRVFDPEVAVDDLRDRVALVEVEVPVVLVAAGGGRERGAAHADLRAVDVGQQTAVAPYGAV